jgi:hypothetical protein
MSDGLIKHSSLSLRPGSMMDPVDKRDFCFGLAEGFFAREDPSSQKKEFSAVVKITPPRSGPQPADAFFALVRARMLPSADGDCFGSVLSLQPLPNSRYMTQGLYLPGGAPDLPMAPSPPASASDVTASPHLDFESHGSAGAPTYSDGGTSSVSTSPLIHPGEIAQLYGPLSSEEPWPLAEGGGVEVVLETTGIEDFDMIDFDALARELDDADTAAAEMHQEEPMMGVAGLRSLGGSLDDAEVFEALQELDNILSAESLQTAVAI